MTKAEDVPLFPGFEPVVLDNEGLSASQRLTLRQYTDVNAGRHPLTRGPLHPDAPTGTDRPHQHQEPFTCGGCRFLEGNGWGYLKCDLPGPDGKLIAGRQTHGPATDMRRWWPACPDYATSE